jgi:two-component system, cell cycle sensor histidine kinase and response regulator CckA
MTEHQGDTHLKERIARLEAELQELRAELGCTTSPSVHVAGIDIEWDPKAGVCAFADLPVAMMWVDSTLAGLMSGVEAMVGTERFLLALQSEGRKSVEADWRVISGFDRFEDGFQAIANIAAVAGWGRWELVELDEVDSRAVFRVTDSWEGLYQRTLGVHWGSGMLAGKLAGFCSRLFGTNCWAEQTEAIHQGDEADVFVASPSDRSLENEIAALHDSMLNRLRKSEEGFRNIVEQSPMGVLLYEIRHGDRLVLTAVNLAAERILGVTGSELMGKTIEEAFPPLAATDLPARYRHVARNGGTWSIQEMSYESEDIRGVYDVLIFQTSPNTVAVNFLDVADRIEAQKEREELQIRLHRSRQMESLGLLAGGVAHDLNNILSGLVTYPDLLLAGRTPEDPMFEPLQVIAESGNRAAAVVKDLLTITRASATEKTPLNLNDLVRDHLRSPEVRLLDDDHAGVVVDMDLAGEPLLVVGSDDHLRKAVTNLVFNAAEACEGKGSVTVRTRRRSLDLAQTGFERIEAGDYVVLTVKDDGAGIAYQDLERIFEPFYSRNVLGRSGTGLGLTVVWNTVRDHQGFIDIESDPTGTVFHLYLPASTESVLKTATHLSLEELKGHGESVLVIDDEEQQRVIVSGMLGKLGYVARAVASGAAALTALASEPADLLILDMIMPGSWGGAETYRRILAEHPGQKAVIASGYAETDDVRATQAAGAGGFLRKPYTLDQLATAIRNELGATPTKGDGLSTL